MRVTFRIKAHVKISICCLKWEDLGALCLPLSIWLGPIPSRGPLPPIRKKEYGNFFANFKWRLFPHLNFLMSSLSFSLARRGLEPPVPYKVTMSVRHSLCLCNLVSNYAAFPDTWEDNKVLCLHLSVWRSPILSQGLLLSVVVWGTESFLPISTVSSSHPPSQFCSWWTWLFLSFSKSVYCLMLIARLSINASFKQVKLFAS